MANKTNGAVTVQLDKERSIVFDLNSLIYAEEHGVDLGNMSKNGGVKMKDLRTILFAGLKHEDKELTPEMVGSMITMKNMEVITEALAEAFGSGGK